MTKYKVVLVPFPFDDLSSSKARPAVCLTEPVGPHRHVAPAFITSRVPAEPLATDLVLDSSDPQFASTGLRVSSTLQLHRLMTATLTLELDDNPWLHLDDFTDGRDAMIYDPYQPPDPDEWLELPEMDRITLVLDYHQGTKEELPNPTVHAAIHATVENQIALGDEIPVKAKLLSLMREGLDRHELSLMREGLDRHEALHAIGSVLAEHIYNLLSHEASQDDINVRYHQALEVLTAESWRQGD